MLFPSVLTWVEKFGEVAAFRIEAREIGAFVRVASVASQREVGRIVIAAVLSGNDVLNLERRKGEVLLFEQTVLAAIAGPAMDKLPDRCVDHTCGAGVRSVRAFACKMPIRSIAST